MVRQPRSLNGYVVAITGAARGIGLATARALAREGARVGIGDLDAELARKAAEEIGGGAIGIELNVTDKASFERFLDEVESSLGPIDVLVNNAGVMQLGPFEGETDANTQRQIDINLTALIWGCKLGLARMLPRGRGHLVNIASMAGKTGFPGGATYSATKHAVVGLSESLRGESSERGIEVHVVMPGVVNTELATGLARVRGMNVVEPEDVAAEIVDALETGRFEVFVPRSVGVLNAIVSAAPRRVREAVGRAMHADKVLANADLERRVDYEARASESDPGVEQRLAERHADAGSPAPEREVEPAG